MHYQKYDPASVTLISILMGASRDEDLNDFIHWSMVLDAEGIRQKKRTAHLAFIDGSYERPNASGRKKLAEALKRFQVQKPLFAMVTRSVAIRGLLIALGWIAPSIHEIGVFASVDEGARWLDAKRGEPLPALQLFEDLKLSLPTPITQ